MKMVSVPEELLEKASASIEQAQVYLTALREIGKFKVETDEGKKLVQIAKNAVEEAGDIQTLSQTNFEN